MTPAPRCGEGERRLSCCVSNHLGKRSLMPEVIIHDDESFERALKRFKKKWEKAGIPADLRKHRRESVEVYEKLGRTEAAATETAEIKALEAFLPAAMAPEEIRAAVREAIAGGAKDLGKVMGAVMPKLKGRADGSLVNTIVREELAASNKS